MAKLTNNDLRKGLVELQHRHNRDALNQKLELEKRLKEIDTMTPSTHDGFESMAGLLAMPDDQFLVLAPAFLEDIEKHYNDPNERMAIIQAMNTLGTKAEDLEAQYLDLCELLEDNLDEALSVPKRDFIK